MSDFQELELKIKPKTAVQKIMDLEGCDYADAQKALDFASLIIFGAQKHEKQIKELKNDKNKVIEMMDVLLGVKPKNEIVAA